MRTFFSEHRLIHRLASDFNSTSAALKKKDRAAVVTAQTNKTIIAQNAAARDSAVSIFNKTAEQNRSPWRREVLGTTKDQYNMGNLPVKLMNPKTGSSVIQYSSAEQKRSAERGRAQGLLDETFAAEEKSARENNPNFDPYEFQQRRQLAQQKLDAEFLRKDTVNVGKANKEATERSNITKPVKPVTTTATTPGRAAITQKSNPGSTMQERITARGQSRAQRLGLEPKQTSEAFTGSKETSAPLDKNATLPSGQSPVITTPSEIPSTAAPTTTNREAEAAGALDNDTVDAPGSLAAIIEEEQDAINPILEGLALSRDAFKIYKSTAESSINKRGKQIEDYKTNSKDRTEQIADAKIDQSKANRDLDLELIDGSRDRARRDVLLGDEKTQMDYDREENRIIGENADRVEKLQTALGGRYGGFGSGKGIAKIQAARDEGSKILRELNEDRIYARRVDQQKLTDIEDKWNETRQVIFNQHDQNVTSAYTSAMEAAQKIDDTALTEEGDQLDAGVELAKSVFDQMDKIFTTTGTALSSANQRALTRRDEVRKEGYTRSQDALRNIFSGLAQLPANSPFFTELEKQAGLTPGTIASTRTNEERRIAISEAGLRISQGQYALQIREFERSGNKIDTDASKLMGKLVTSTGEIFRDVFGNPVNLVGPSGSVTSTIGNDTKLFGSEMVGLNSTVNFSRYAMQMGDIVPGSPFHKGGEYDIDGRSGDTIPAWLSGTVTSVGTDPSNPYGNYVDIYDGVNTTRYAHLQSVNVVPGQFIQGTNSGQPQIVGSMGNSGNVLGMDGQAPIAGDTETGSHLHFEVRTGKDFATGKVVDPMDVGMQPGLMHGGNIVWVDDMRKQMRQGQAIGQNLDGSTMTASNLDTPWQEIDQQILELSKDVFKDGEGKTDWKAVGLVFDYLQQHKMGDYQVSYTGEGAIQGVQQASKEIAYNQQTHGRNVVQDRTLISKGFIDPDTFAASLTDGTLAEMNEAEMHQYVNDMGYIVEDGSIWGYSVREMDSAELQVLNQRRQAQGLPPLQ